MTRKQKNPPEGRALKKKSDGEELTIPPSQNFRPGCKSFLHTVVLRPFPGWFSHNQQEKTMHYKDTLRQLRSPMRSAAPAGCPPNNPLLRPRRATAAPTCRRWPRGSTTTAT